MAGWKDRQNSFNGKIEGFEDISVDNFYDKTKKAYFLSHFHSDHYGGLIGKNGRHASDLMESEPKKKIYMTEPTRIIFSIHYPDDYNELEHIIVTLQTGQTYSNLDDLDIDVTLQEVTHMPGAVMFIFAKPSWKVLYTGDFVMRTSGEEELAELKSLHDEDGNPLTFDYMYYDATFEEKPALPTRAQCIENVVPIIEDWLNLSEENFVVFMTYYDYAYEELFAEISRHMEEKKIYIHDAKQIDVYK
ncbi:unnamed protein product [Diatraea saccharalis]|uniref:Metallo-beta-lactamase domain-containing protein n=1 Tax=Diatraea saccharalis TaxID=40085 RepID=A0A9N9R516_9NEOP|nr:unnamed protein product [Diatraea saccharalis]